MISGIFVLSDGFENKIEGIFTAFSVFCRVILLKNYID